MAEPPIPLPALPLPLPLPLPPTAAPLPLDYDASPDCRGRLTATQMLVGFSGGMLSMTCAFLTTICTGFAIRQLAFDHPVSAIVSFVVALFLAAITVALLVVFKRYLDRARGISPRRAKR